MLKLSFITRYMYIKVLNKGANLTFEVMRTI